MNNYSDQLYLELEELVAKYVNIIIHIEGRNWDFVCLWQNVVTDRFSSPLSEFLGDNVINYLYVKSIIKQETDQISAWHSSVSPDKWC